MQAKRQDRIFRNIRMIDGTPVELLCRDGRIAAIEPQPQGGTAGTGDGFTPTGVAVHDGGNRLLLPPLVESHIHLDKTLWGQAWRPNSGGPRLKDYISNERRILREIKEPVGSRAAALLEHCLALGSLKMRSHIDIDPEIGLHHAEALLELRERYRNLVDLDFVAFPQSGLLHAPGTAELMEQAIEMGVETIGGLDPAGIDHDPIGHLRLIFDLAAKHGCGIDIHLHDAGELGLWQIDRIADFTAASGLAGKVMVSHAYCLGAVPTAQIEVLGQRLAALDISLMTTAPSDTTLPPVDFLQQLGVNICCGSDNIRDAWAPFGTGDMLERALFLALRLDWSKDTEIAAAFDCVSQNGAHALGLDSQDRYGLAPGCPADFVLVDAETLGDAIARRPHARTIVRGGTVIAEDGSLIRSQR